jgi:CheY-like chemotaxis protein
VAKILVADDNSNIQKMVGLALKDQGIDVVAVGNGEAAVRKISDIKPDLVLADVFMPVRNGYEVCKYVKEDPALAHIPVILLVGAFDPLDEQEAQRVGADGVLKKPFVPPDPLISMVKSALIRAGVPVGPAPAAEKAPAIAKRSTSDILSAGIAGMSSKLAALAPEKLPEAFPEPVEEFLTPPAGVKIAAGSEPLAFGSLLDTPEAEEEAAVTAKPMINLSEAREWAEEPDEVAEEDEESPRSGWQPSALEEDLEKAAKPANGTPDWREEAFHGNSPAKNHSSKRWAPSLERPNFAEAAEAQSVAVATITTKPDEGPAPFSGDAWAAAMAAGVEEKLAQAKDLAALVPEAVAPSHASELKPEEIAGTVTAALETSSAAIHPAIEETKAAEPANWAAVPETAWEMEAKKASLLASTWDTPKTFSVDETQEIPAYIAEAPRENSELLAAAPAEVQAGVQADASPEPSPYSAEPVIAPEPVETAEAPIEESPAEPAFEASSEPKSWENAWEAPVVPPAPALIEDLPEETAHLEEHHDLPRTASEEKLETAPAEPTQPDMDEIVARVLGKMSPEVLQKVTREILKPVIEAIVRDEINSKKS